MDRRRMPSPSSSPRPIGRLSHRFCSGRGLVSSSLLALLALLLLAVIIAEPEVLEYHSFQPPFQAVDNSGLRLASPHWRSAGTTVINNNFIRLTPDRQSKKGALWSRKTLSTPSFTSFLKFRISGQGKQFFGDGIALWIVQQSYFVEGPLQGFIEQFMGIGVIFDTFRNTEHAQIHRDVTVLINNGTRNLEQMTTVVHGCDANVRYHADRADFSVLDASRAKIVVNETHLAVYVDERDSGEWTLCTEVSDLDKHLPPGWIERSHLGLTASTGQLADNHDIISLKTMTTRGVTADEEEVRALEQRVETTPPAFGLEEDLPVGDKFKR